VRTCGAGTRVAGAELGGPGPLALSPREEVSPNPSCPLSFWPQHLRVASSCGEKQPRITDRLRKDGWGEYLDQGWRLRCR